MKRLYILRHAKSSWDDPDLSDFERPLNDRGETAAPYMGKLLSRERLVPDVILSSPARRAKDTALRVKESCDCEADLIYDERIYEASPRLLRDVASEIDDSFASAMIVGHNPGIEGFIRYLTGEEERMPTAALAVIDLDIDNWGRISGKMGTLKRVFRPREEMRTKSGAA